MFNVRHESVPTRMSCLLPSRPRVEKVHSDVSRVVPGQEGSTYQESRDLEEAHECLAKKREDGKAHVLAELSRSISVDRCCRESRSAARHCRGCLPGACAAPNAVKAPSCGHVGSFQAEALLRMHPFP